VIENSSSNILYGLSTITAALASIVVPKTFTGRIGLDAASFSTGGTATDSDAAEYRDTYLEVDVASIELGQQTGPGSPAGSPRIKISNTKAGASVLTVYDTNSSSSESFLPAVRYHADNAAADVNVIEAPGGVGIGMDYDGETATVGDVVLKSTSTSDRLFIGSGVTWTNYTQYGGSAVIDGAADVTSINAWSGDLEINGDFGCTTLTNNGCEIVDNHVKTAGNAVTTINNNSGSLDLDRSTNERTIATLNQGDSATLILDPNVVTVTSYNNPSTRFTASFEPVV